MRIIDKLAREICWVGFALPTQAGTTKAKYWNSLPEETRESYRFEAAKFIWVLNHINCDLLNEVVHLAYPKTMAAAE